MTGFPEELARDIYLEGLVFERKYREWLNKQPQEEDTYEVIEEQKQLHAKNSITTSNTSNTANDFISDVKTEAKEEERDRKVK